MTLSSLGFTEGFYYKPRIDYETLAAHSEGLIGLSACLAGDIPKLLEQGRFDDAKAAARRINQIFGQGSFYLELQDHGLPGQKEVNNALIQISGKRASPWLQPMMFTISTEKMQMPMKYCCVYRPENSRG